MRRQPAGVGFADLREVCEAHFGPPRQSGTSPLVFRTPWPGDPRVNVQPGEAGKAKAYPVCQVLRAIDRLKELP